MDLTASGASHAAMNRLFYAYNDLRRRLDTTLNGLHSNALRTVSRFLGTGHYDYAEFFAGRLVNGHLVPF